MDSNGTRGEAAKRSCGFLDVACKIEEAYTSKMPGALVGGMVKLESLLCGLHKEHRRISLPGAPLNVTAVTVRLAGLAARTEAVGFYLNVSIVDNDGTEWEYPGNIYPVVGAPHVPKNMVGLTLRANLINSLVWFLFQKGLLKATLDNSIIYKYTKGWIGLSTYTLAPLFPALLNFPCGSYRKGCWQLGSNPMALTMRARDMPSIDFQGDRLHFKFPGQIDFHGEYQKKMFHAITMAFGVVMAVRIHVDNEGEKPSKIGVQLTNLDIDGFRVVASKIGMHHEKLMGALSFASRLVSGVAMTIGNYFLYRTRVTMPAKPISVSGVNVQLKYSELSLDANLEDTGIWNLIKEKAGDTLTEMVKTGFVEPIGVVTQEIAAAFKEMGMTPEEGYKIAEQYRMGDESTREELEAKYKTWSAKK